MAKLLTWQRIKQYPITGQMFGANNTRMNVYDSYDRFMHKKVVEYTPIIEQKPLPTVSFIRDRTVPHNSPNVTYDTGEIRIDATAQKTALYTRQTGRYLPGLYGLAGIGVRFNDMTTGVYEFGYGNDEGNRIGIRVDNGEMYTFIDSGGVNRVMRARADWLDPLDGTGPSKIKVDDLSKIVFRVQIGWYGYLSIEYKLVVSSREDGDQIITIDTEGLETTDSVSIENPDLPIFAEADGGIMFVGGRQYGVYGRYRPEYRITTTQLVTKSIPTTDFVPVMSLKMKSAQKWSSVPVQFDRVVAELDNTCEVRLILHDSDDGLLTGAAFSDVGLDGIDPEETALEMDTSATDLATGGYKMYSTLFVGGSGRNSEGGISDAPDIVIPKGLIVTMVAKAVTTTANLTSLLKFREEW